MRTVNEILDEIKKLKGLKTDTELAGLFYVKPNTVSNWRKRNTLPYEQIITFCEKENVDIRNILLGKNGDKTIPFDPRITNTYSPEYRLIKEAAIVDVYPSNGKETPGELLKSGPIESIVIPAYLMKDSIITIKIKNNSMEPTIVENAYIGVDMLDKELISGKLYAVFIHPEGIVVKRLYVDVWRIILNSDNQLFPELSIPFENIPAEDFILGRVRWVIQRL
jgi:phage repressor protein C with HTH and peptisase S24 domain